ncbi:uncharacterized protein BX664DRAFT_389682 [Halteromyces radiatus]|uniref:uncharacterized protein n=1 Tax=Halteromyces radiatus TaxID=101107 RepID=UPI00222105B4|nr:uncharacterized protein BX664DRAFT_389682 [Halteromyces radiatus]KAI8076355.1 hypothetical protein BX664DRAFT_389682 [Halteromyces radiatus]
MVYKQDENTFDLISTWLFELYIETNNYEKWYNSEELIYEKRRTTIKEKIENTRPLNSNKTFLRITEAINHHHHLISYSMVDKMTLWIQKWLWKRAVSMAKKDSKLVSSRGRIYSATEILPKIIQCYRESMNHQCHFCRRYLMMATYGSCSQSTLASFDHAIPKTPVLAPGNKFLLTCLMCNLAKHTLTTDQFQQFIDLVRSTSYSRPPILPLHQQDIHEAKKEASRTLSQHKQMQRKYVDKFEGKSMPTKHQLETLAKQAGLFDPYTNIRGHYTTQKDLAPFRMVFGRRQRKVYNPLDGTHMIHGYYIENTIPMLLIIKYAFHVFTEYEVISWIQAIRHHPIRKFNF